MNFREALEDDLENAFFDEDEFASRHVIDGEECTIVMTEITSAEAKTRKSLNPKESAINDIRYVLYIREKDMKRKLTVNAMISLDGKKYFVRDVKHHEGMYEVAIGIHAV